MSESRVKQDYKGYEISAIKKTFWVVYIYSVDKNVEHAVCKEIITNALKCNDAIQRAKQFIDDHEWKFIDSENDFKFYTHLKFNGDYEYKITSDSYEKIFPVDSLKIATDLIRVVLENCKWKFIQEVYSFSIYIRLTPFYKWTYKIEKGGTLIEEVQNLENEERVIRDSLENINERLWEFATNYDAFKIRVRLSIYGLWDYKIEHGNETIELHTGFDERDFAIRFAMGSADKRYQKIKKIKPPS